MGSQCVGRLCPTCTLAVKQAMRSVFEQEKQLAWKPPVPALTDYKPLITSLRK
ncbi:MULTISPECIES: hypothetical protein [unclassified Nostoc]|uniref:hypothetical protein n=1 Tax=unclassified Nostoc TaxID=2593658 RepID=UPI00261F4BAD|nr:hypothetical protein [Nostoc sp. S13]MDF5735105.1 hypothetical protein [Nostoc sp. S13]